MRRSHPAIDGTLCVEIFNERRDALRSLAESHATIRETSFILERPEGVRPLSHFLRSDNQMNQAIWRGDEEAVEIFAQLLDFVAARDAVDFQE